MRNDYENEKEDKGLTLSDNWKHQKKERLSNPIINFSIASLIKLMLLDIKAVDLRNAYENQKEDRRAYTFR